LRPGQIAIAHNGNLTNAAHLREELEARGSIFQTTVDSEIILHLMAQPIVNGEANNLVRTMRRIEGAYSLVIMTDNELIGVRDPFGFRPLCIGKIDDAWVLSSESCALDLIHAKFVRDVEPGEIVIINENGLTSMQAFPSTSAARFAFSSTFISLAPTAPFQTGMYTRSASRWAAIGARISHLGRRGRAVPDSGNCPALGYSLETGIPYEMAFVRNHYSGAAFCSRHN